MCSDENGEDELDQIAKRVSCTPLSKLIVKKSTPLACSFLHASPLEQNKRPHPSSATSPTDPKKIKSPSAHSSKISPIVDDPSSHATVAETLKYTPTNPLLKLKKLKGPTLRSRVKMVADEDVEEIEDVEECENDSFEANQQNQPEDGGEIGYSISDFLSGRADITEERKREKMQTKTKIQQKILPSTLKKKESDTASGHWRTVTKDGVKKKVFASPSGKTIKGRGGFASYIKSKRSKK